MIILVVLVMKCSNFDEKDLVFNIRGQSFIMGGGTINWEGWGSIKLWVSWAQSAII